MQKKTSEKNKFADANAYACDPVIFYGK